MPVHDWIRVDAGIFHSFHLSWLAKLSDALNGGLLPEGFYSLTEQHAGRTIPDILTLHTSAAKLQPLPPISTSGGTAVAEAPPRVRLRETVEAAATARRRSVAVRHVSGHRLVALLEIVSPANKDRPKTVDDFAVKVVDALDAGIHVVVVDLFPPGPYDPQGMHGAIRSRLVAEDDSYELPADEPLTVAGYVAGVRIDIYLEQMAVGAVLPEMPLFLTQQRYVNLPLEPTYRDAYERMPAFWRGVLEGKQDVL